ncbi:unnamed protein product, partial [Ectocarpus sp. 6 AP-2014]
SGAPRTTRCVGDRLGRCFRSGIGKGALSSLSWVSKGARTLRRCDIPGPKSSTALETTHQPTTSHNVPTIREIRCGRVVAYQLQTDRGLPDQERRKTPTHGNATEVTR